MKNEQKYQVELKHSELREVQLALMYHLDNVMLPYLDQISRKQDYIPTQEVQRKIAILQGVLDDLNQKAGIYTERE